tara:strand:- start:8154 stop:8870 length:717 start_codon:yes stop_codon:yes gene_type:complete
MCFTQNISFSIGIIGILAAFILFNNKFYYASIATFYFSLMEIIQGFQYFVINQCKNNINKLLTYIGYIHICFQPVFISLLLYEFVNNKKKNFNYLLFIISISLIGGLLLFSRIYVPNNNELCNYRIEPLCGKNTCSLSGLYHIIWHIRLRAPGSYWLTPSMGLHFFLWVVPFIVFGLILKNYKIIILTLFTIIIPIILTILIYYKNLSYEDFIHEIPSIWCIIFIPQIIITFIILFLF